MKEGHGVGSECRFMTFVSEFKKSASPLETKRGIFDICHRILNVAEIYTTEKPIEYIRRRFVLSHTLS